MRCKACDCAMNITESVIKNPRTGDYEELCANCLLAAGLYDAFITPDGESSQTEDEEGDSGYYSSDMDVIDD